MTLSFEKKNLSYGFNFFFEIIGLKRLACSLVGEQVTSTTPACYLRFFCSLRLVRPSVRAYVHYPKVNYFILSLVVPRPKVRTLILELLVLYCTVLLS